MAKVRFTRNLSRFFPGLGDADVSDAATVRALIGRLEERHPGLAAYLVEDDGRLRKHVNVFVDGQSIADRDGLSDALGAGSDVYIAQALSGG